MRLGSSLVCKSSVKSNITEWNGYHKRTGLFTILLKLLLSIFNTIPLVCTHRQSTWKSSVFPMVEVYVGQNDIFWCFGDLLLPKFWVRWRFFNIELSFGKKYYSLYHDKVCLSSETFTVLSFYLALFLLAAIFMPFIQLTLGSRQVFTWLLLCWCIVSTLLDSGYSRRAL